MVRDVAWGSITGIACMRPGVRFSIQQERKK